MPLGSMPFFSSCLLLVLGYVEISGLCKESFLLTVEGSALGQLQLPVADRLRFHTQFQLSGVGLFGGLVVFPIYMGLLGFVINWNYYSLADQGICKSFSSSPLSLLSLSFYNFVTHPIVMHFILHL